MTNSDMRGRALLLKASDKLGTVASYKFDLIDLGRQVIGNKFAATYSEYRAAFLQQNKTACAALSQQLLVRTRPHDDPTRPHES